MTRNIVSWLEKRLGPTRQASSHSEITVCCPLCPDGDAGYHLYYNPHKNVFNCFKCGSSGQGLDLVMAVDNVNALTAARALSPHVPTLPKPIKVITDLPDWYKPLIPKPDEPKPVYSLAYNYALARGFTESAMLKYGLGYVLGDYKHRNRLIFPVERGYYQARACFKFMKPKYINPDVPKGDRLFGYNYLGSSKLAVCEGCISAIAAFTEDIPAIAVLGKTVLPEQAKRIVDSHPAVIEIAFDAGTETADGTLEFAEYLHSYDITVIIRSYKFGDPDECKEYSKWEYKPTYKLQARLMRIK